MNLRTLLSFIILIILFPNKTDAQNNYAIGGGFGIGGFMGNFPTQTIIGTKVFIEIPSMISVFDKIQFNFSAGQKIEKFLPDSYKLDHYSHFSSLGISGIFEQELNLFFNIQESVGFIYFNDRSFNDINSWNFGILLNLGIGTRINEYLDISLNLDYGITVNNTNASYFLFLLDGKYYW